jgi:IS30 family transposase
VCVLTLFQNEAELSELRASGFLPSSQVSAPQKRGASSCLLCVVQKLRCYPFRFCRPLSPFFAFLYLPNTLQLPQSLQFELRHLHAVTSDGHVYFADPSDTLRTQSNEKLAPQTRMVRRHKLPSGEAVKDTQRRSIVDKQSSTLGWNKDKVVVPNVKKHNTLLTLANMTRAPQFCGLRG